MAFAQIGSLLVPVQHEGWVTIAMDTAVLTIPRTNLNYDKHIVVCRGPVCWNNVEVNIKAVESLSQRKSLVEMK